MPEFTEFEIDLFRQWFNAVQDLNPKYLEEEDYRLAEKVYMTLGKDVPLSVSERR